MEPAVGRSSPAMRPSSGDLPLPDGPVTATVSRAATSRFTPSRIATSRPPLRSRITRSRTWRIIRPILHLAREAASHPPHRLRARPRARAGDDSRSRGDRRRARDRGARRQPHGGPGRRARRGLAGAARSPAPSGGSEYRVVNAGVSGDTSAGGLARLDWVLRNDPEIVIVALGANDGL